LGSSGDIDIGLGQNAYLRAELLYGGMWRFEESTSKIYGVQEVELRPCNGLTLKTGIGFKIKDKRGRIKTM
jgi:hypothetical protein